MGERAGGPVSEAWDPTHLNTSARVRGASPKALPRGTASRGRSQAASRVARRNENIPGGTTLSTPPAVTSALRDPVPRAMPMSAPAGPWERAGGRRGAASTSGGRRRMRVRSPTYARGGGDV